MAINLVVAKIEYLRTLREGDSKAKSKRYSTK